MSSGSALHRNGLRLLAVALLAAGSGLVQRPAEAADPFLRRTPTVRAVEQVGPAVVNITTEQVVRGGNPFRGFGGNPTFERFFRDFFVPRAPRTTQSLGSGVVIDRMRHVLTNEHVITRADRIFVTLADGRFFEANLVGADPNNDLAVLRVETDEEVPWIAPGDSDDLMVGEPVIAIGNPFGLSNTVTTGVISAQNRSIRAQDRVYHGFLQTDASINPGNSGGPLLNAAGELIGINTAIYGGAEGIGFAIPIDAAERVVRELIRKGEIAPVWLGLDLQDLDEQISEVLEVPERLTGALVSRVRPGTPAAEAEIARGDVVTSVDGSGVANARGFYEILERSTTGQVLALGVWREGSVREVKVRSEEISDEAVTELGEQMLGMHLRLVPGGGFAVREVRRQSGAARIGIEAGDRLLGINGKALDGEEALRRAVLDLRGRARALIVVQRGRGRYHVTVPLG